MDIQNYKKEEAYLKAKKRMNDIKGFYYHLFVTIFAIPVVIGVNLQFVPNFYFFWYAVIGMLFGLFFHWLGVFGFEKLGLGKDWEQKKIKEMMEKDNFKNL